jgi:cytochrome o ubiquinol oxidase subunit 1
MYRGRIRFTVPMMYLIAFIVTFVIGGMTGVLLALPPADYLMHNTTFLVAHFHNMLIPGALFGYFAALNMWFPKAFGFKLDHKWGVRSFWCWVIGFYLAFMPLYLLGFMGMPRRMEHYDTPAWQPWLIVAFVGAMLILFGLAFLIVQIAVSFRNRAALRDWTGDPWHGRTLEWATSSPPAPYNFAVLPQVEDLAAFHDMKARGVAYQRPARYVDILMPKNSFGGMVLGGLAFVLGFAAVWHMWWLVAACFVAAVISIIIRASSDDTEYVMTAAEVEAIENQRYEDLARAPPADLEGVPIGIPGAPIPAGRGS